MNIQGDDVTPPPLSISTPPKTIKRRGAKKSIAEKNYSAIVGLLRQQHEYKLLGEMEFCGRAVGRRMKFIRVPDGADYRGGELFCRSRHCPLCTQAGAASWGRDMERLTDKILTESPTTEFLLATFKTGREVIIKSAESARKISDEVNLLMKALSRLVKRKELRKDFLGMIRIIEVSLNPSTLGAWVHVHCVFAMKPTYFRNAGHYLNSESWRRLWATSLNVDGLTPEVWLKRLRKNSGASTEPISKVVGRWVQYGLKASWLNVVPKIPVPSSALLALKTILKALRGRRLIATTGKFHGADCQPARVQK